MSASSAEDYRSRAFPVSYCWTWAVPFPTLRDFLPIRSGLEPLMPSLGKARSEVHGTTTPVVACLQAAVSGENTL